MTDPQPYPRDVCIDCGSKHRRRGNPNDVNCITMSMGTCDVCGGKEVGVTTPGDFGYPDFPRHEKLKRKPIHLWD